MAILKLKPTCKDYIWGGNRLKNEFGFEYDGDVLAEAWVLSCYPDSPSTIVNGEHMGESLREYLEKAGPAALGTNCSRFPDFPILIKFIDAKQNLSIQVHPDNEYARIHEHQFGKTEMWYVMDCDEGAYLYYGFEKEISRDEFERRIRDNSLLEVLHAAPVHKGDVFFIEAGTLHAICKGILIAEIQQNSNVTYRIYDYGRLGKDGKPRALHIAQALDVTKRGPVSGLPDMGGHLGACDYFVVDKFDSDGSAPRTGSAGADTFVSILILDGAGEIACGTDRETFKKGDSIFLPAGSGDFSLSGRFESLMTTERPDA